jgi:hypothetical protein
VPPSPPHSTTEADWRTDAFRNTMNAALGRAKDGEGLTSAVETILATWLNHFT